MLLIPALLFRTMSTVHLEQLDLRFIAAYFVAALGLFGVLVATVLAGVFSTWS